MFKTCVSFLFHLFISCLFLVYYVVHLYGYLNEWRKNPHWSFTCCLTFFLPLVDLHGEVKAMTDTDILNTQLDTGQMEMSTVTGVVKDSGVVNVAIKEGVQGDHNSAEVREDNCNDARLQTEGKETPTNLGAIKTSVASDVTLKEDEKSQANTICAKKGVGHDLRYNNKTVHQKTQTKFSTHYSITSEGVEESFL